MVDRTQLPQATQPIAVSQDRALTLFVERVWYQFFRFIEGSITNFGVQADVNEAVTATGTTQADATLVGAWSVVTVVPANSGVILDTGGEGTSSKVWNRGANALDVYPPSGCQIDALGTNVPYPLPINTMQEFSQVGPTQWMSTQLG